MRSHAAVLGLAAIAVLASGPVAPVHAETLLEALADGYTTNPTLLSARARLRSVDEGVPQALANWRPSVSASTQASNQARQLMQGGVTTNQGGTALSTTMTVAQPIWRGGRTVADTERAEFSVLAERARLASTEQTVLLAIVNSYLNVVRDKAVLDLSINNVEVLTRQLDATRDRFRVGELTRTDVAQAESRLQAAVAAQAQAQGNLTSSIAAYVQNVGHEPGVLTYPEPLKGLPANDKSAADEARSANPSVVAANYDQRAADRSIRLVEGELYPTVTLNGTVTYNHDVDPIGNTAGNEAFTETAAATVTVPLYTNGNVYSRLRAAKQTDSQRRQDLAAAVRAAIQSATAAWERRQTGFASVAAFQAAVRAQEIAYQGVQEEARVGARTTLDVLDAEQELFTQRTNLLKAQRDALFAEYEVYSAVGRLTASGLSLSVTPYDDKEYYSRMRNRWFGAGVDR